MMHFSNKSKTALLAVAVLLIGILSSGCVTKRDIEEVKSMISKAESENRETLRLVLHMDSVITAGAEASQALRGEMRYSMDEITQQVAQLLENYNALLNAMNQLSQRQPIRLSPKSSPGAQDNSTIKPDSTIVNNVTQPIEPIIQNNCDSIYDESFLLTRQSEYQKAIEGFTLFLEKCPKHQNVENARYWTGECYFSLEKYPQAISEFDLLLSEFPSSVNSGRATYKLARSKQELGKLDEAKKLFRQLADDQPNTLEGQQAKERLKDLR